MRNFMNGISKGLAFLMAAAMVFTSVPTPAFANEIVLDTAEESISLETVDEAAPEAATNDSLTVTEDSYIDSDVAAETSSDVTIEGEEENVDPEGDGETRKLRMVTVGAQNQTIGKYVKGGAVANGPKDDSYKKIGALEFAYGQTYDDFTYEVQDFFPAEPAVYGGTGWTVYKLKDNTAAGDEAFDGTDEDGGVWKAYMDMAFGDSSTTAYADAKKAVEDSLDKEAGTNNAVLPTGIEVKVVNGKLTFTKNATYGAPVQAGEWYYVIKISDSAVATNADVYTNAFKITVYGADNATKNNLVTFGDESGARDIQINDSSDDPTDPSYVEGEGKDFAVPAKITNDYEKLGTIVFAPKDTNYEVHDAPRPTSLEPDKWVEPRTITLAAVTLNEKTAVKNSAYEIRDITTGKVITNKFSVVADKTELYSGNKVTLKINPVEGLEAGLTEALLCIYQENETLKTKAYETMKIIRLQFTANSDINLIAKRDGKVVNEFYLKIAKDTLTPTFASRDYYYLDEGDYVLADSAKKTASAAKALCDFYVVGGAVDEPIDLGEAEFGKTVNIQFIAQGGGEGLDLDGETETEVGTFDGVSGAFDSLDKIAAAGFELVPGSGEEVTASLGNAFKIRDGKTPLWATEAESLNTITFGLAATDYSTEDDPANKSVKYFTLTPTPLDVTVTAGTEKMVTGKKDATNTFKWSAADDTELDEDTATITIHNPSTVAIKVEGKLAANTTDPTGPYTDGTIDFASPAISDGKYTVAIPAGGDGVFVVKPSALKNDTTDRYANSALLLTCPGFRETDIVLNFEKAAAGQYVTITDPEGATLEGKNKAEIGKPYSHTFKAVKNGTVEGPKWYIATSNADMGTATVQTGCNDIATINGGSDCESATYLSETYGLSLDPETGILSADPVLLKKGLDGRNAGNVNFCLAAKYWVGSTAKYVAKKVTLTVAKPEKSIELVSGSTTMNDFDDSDNNVLDMGTVGLDSGTGMATVVNINNKTAVDLNNVMVAITEVKRYEDDKLKETKTTSIGDWFKIVFSDNATIQTDATTNGTSIKANASTPFTIQSVPATGAGTDIKAGDYEVKVEITPAPNSVVIDDPQSDDPSDTIKANVISYFAAPITFTALLTVGDAPIIEARANTINGTIIVGNKTADVNTKGFTAVLTSDPTKQFEITWKKDPTAAATDLDIAESGLYINGDGLLSTKAPGTTTDGKVLKAGIYKIVVMATSRTTGDGLYGEKAFELIISGNTTVTVKATGDDNDLTADKTWVMPAQIYGKTPAVSQEFTIGINKDVKNVKVEISDAEDDRTADDIAKSNDNPYTGNSQYFAVDKTAAFDALTSKTNTFTISATGNPLAGRYKAKVTLTGDNMTTRHFYVYLIVVDKLTINKITDAQAMVGEPYVRAINAVGADIDQNIKWTEVDPADESKSELARTNAKSIYTLTGNTVDLYARGETTRTIKVKEKNGVPLQLTARTTFLGVDSYTSMDDEGLDENLVAPEVAPAKSGTFSVTVRALAPAADIAPVTTTASNVGKTYLNTTDALPEQDDVMTFNLVVAKSDAITKAKLYRIGQDAVTPTIDGINIIGNKVAKNEDDLKWYDEGIVGTLTNSDSEYSDYTGYVLKPDTEKYTNGANTDGVTWTINSYAQTVMPLTAELKKGKTSPFKFLSVTGDLDTAWTAAAAPLADVKGTFKMEASIDGETAKSAAIVIVPADDLEASETPYTDKLVISGDDMQGKIELDITFSVQNETYLTSTTYKPYTAAAADDPSELVVDNVVQSGAKIVLRTATVDEANTDATLEAMSNATFRIKNTGNSLINYVKVEEVKYDESTGKVTSLGSASKILATGTGVSTIDLTDAGDIQAAKAKGSDGVPRDKNVAFKLKPTKIDTVGLHKTYIQISFKGNGKTISYVVPVEYLVVNKDLDDKVTVDPSGSIKIADAEENYAAGSAKRTITVTNGNDAGDENALDTLIVTVESGFTLTSTGADLGDGTGILVFYTVPAQGSVTFDVVADPGMPQKDSYSAALVVDANNFKKAKSSTVTFKVTASENFEDNVYDNAGLNAGANTETTTVDAGFTERLFNSLVKGAVVKKNTKILGVAPKNDTTTIGGADITVADDHIALALDLDGNKKTDVVVDFAATTATGPVYTLTTGSEATVYKAGKDKFTLSSPFIELSDAEIAEITKDDIKDAKTTPYFKKMTFNMFAELRFKVDVTAGDPVYFTDLALTLKDNKNIILRDSTGTAIEVTDKTKATTIDMIDVTVPFGATVGSVVGSAMPQARTAEQSFESWVFEYPTGISNKLDATTPVELSVLLTPTWHTHVWPTSATTSNENVVWTWKGSDAEGYKDPSVTIYCTKSDCPDREGSKKTFTGATSPRVNFEEVESVPATCTKGPRKEYRANVALDASHIYSDVKAVENGQPLGHSYTATVVWNSEVKTDEKTGKKETVWTPQVTLTCTQCSEDTEGHTYVVPASNVELKVETTKEATCLEAGEKKYTLVSCKDSKGNVVESYVEGTEKIKTSVLEATGHQVNFTKESVVVEPNADFSKAKVVITCPIHGELFNGNVDLTQDPKNPARYTAEVTFANGEKYVVEAYTHQHVWVAKWADWTRKDATDKFSWTTSLTLTCNVGSVPEIETPEVTVTPTKDGDKYIDYVATATANDGTKYTSEVWTVDAVTGEPTQKHTHEWKVSEWAWSTKDDASVTFICTKGEKPEYKTVTATVTVVKTNSKGNSYCKATAKDPDGKNEVEKFGWFDASGKPTTGDGIGIEGLLEEYEYTGSAIKPVFTVVDYEADKTLVANTDYTIKWTNNNPKITALPMTATVTIKGKGNYDKQEVSRTFTIVNPTKDEDVKDYYTVKSVKTSKETLTYDGTAKYPATVTVKTDAGDVIAAWNGSEYELPTTATKSLKFSVSNNIDKGSGTVAVYGNDGKGKFTTKKASFSIKACDLSALGDKLEITTEAAPYAKSGATTKVTVNFTNESGDTLTLVEGRDYTVKYEYYGNPKKDAGTEAAGAYIVGKGNYTKNTKNSKISKFDIEALALTDDNVAVEAYDKTAVKSLKIKVFDGQGNEINKKYYSLVRVEKGGDELAPATKLAAGDEISVTIKGDGKNVSDTEYTVSTKVGAKMSSAKINAKSVVKTYTGEPITLDSDDWAKISVTVKINGADVTLEQGTDFEVVGYKNNNKKGSMTVIIRGLGSDEKPVNGTKNFTVKVNAKTIKDANK